MIRTQIQLEKYVWEKLRERAFGRRKSVAALVREAVRKDLGLIEPKRKYRLAEFGFVGSGRSKGPGAGYISERHDEEFVKAILKEK